MVIGHKRQTNRILGQLEVNVNGEPIKMESAKGKVPRNYGG